MQDVEIVKYFVTFLFICDCIQIFNVIRIEYVYFLVIIIKQQHEKIFLAIQCNDI